MLLFDVVTVDQTYYSFGDATAVGVVSAMTSRDWSASLKLIQLENIPDIDISAVTTLLLKVTTLKRLQVNHCRACDALTVFKAIHAKI